ncbi:MAG: hypothetical protein DRP35_02405 [Candidatus Zixiibacteriota bacterium]|nr:MAG: hypothetical protein DRP35_02405 [candidate division Zixibacteria bacterium]
MNNTVFSRKLLILSVFVMSLLTLIIITGCDDDDDAVITGPSTGEEVTWTMERGDIGNNILYSVFFINATTGWAVGDNGTIIKYQDVICIDTVNNIIDSNFTDCRWKKLTSGITNSLFDAYFLDASTGWAVGQNGYILNTTDGGDSWSLDTTYKVCYFGPKTIEEDIHAVFFNSTTNGWVVGKDGAIYRYAVDSACIDTQYNIDTIIDTSLYDTLFNYINSDTIFDTTYYIYDTTFVYIDSIINSIDDVTFDTVWIMIDSTLNEEITETIIVDTIEVGIFDTLEFIVDTIYDSISNYPDEVMIDTIHDTSTIITQIDTLTGDTISIDTFLSLVIDTINNDTIIFPIPDTTFNVTGSNIIQSQSGWFSVFTSIAANLWDVFFVDANTGWVTGNLGTIAKTVDGGSTWVIQDPGLTSPLKSISFVDSQTGWIVGDNGIILHTYDGGITWDKQFQNSADINHFIDVTFTDELNGWTVNTKGDVYRTADGGNSWYVDRQGFELGWNSIFFLDDTTGWVVGFDGNIMHAE